MRILPTRLDLISPGIRTRRSTGSFATNATAEFVSLQMHIQGHFWNTGVKGHRSAQAAMRTRQEVNLRLSILLPKIFISTCEEAALGIVPERIEQCRDHKFDIPNSSDIELEYPEESGSDSVKARRY